MQCEVAQELNIDGQYKIVSSALDRQIFSYLDKNGNHHNQLLNKLHISYSEYVVCEPSHLMDCFYLRPDRL